MKSDVCVEEARSCEIGVSCSYSYSQYNVKSEEFNGQAGTSTNGVSESNSFSQFNVCEIGGKVPRILLVKVVCSLSLTLVLSLLVPTC